MKRVALALLAISLGACATQSSNLNPEPSVALLDPLLARIPGRYSNHQQSRAEKGAVPVYELVLDRGASVDEIILIAERTDQENALRQWRLYQIDATNDPKRFQLRVAGANDEQMSQSPEDILNATLRRVTEDCRINATLDQGALAGSTEPGRCVVDSPLDGRQVIELGIRFDTNTLMLTEQRNQAVQRLEFDRLETFAVTGFMQGSRAKPQREAPEWLETRPFTIDSNGARRPLQDLQGQSLGFSAQLDNQSRSTRSPQGWKLSVINDATGAVQSYLISPAESREIKLEQSWINLRLVRAARPVRP